MSEPLTPEDCIKAIGNIRRHHFPPRPEYDFIGGQREAEIYKKAISQYADKQESERERMRTFIHKKP